jgi:dipeptidyl aminopeptidase/acylaminoacyl peptidase
MIRRFFTTFLLFFFTALSVSASEKPKLRIDEFFNFVGFNAIQVSPAGDAVVIAAERPDWDENIFRDELWLYRDDGHGPGSLIQLTQSGHDSHPQWSPDGKWIAFLSGRKTAESSGSSVEDPKNEPAQICLISPTGGEAFPLTQGDEDVHAFAWSADSRSLYFSTRTPWTKTQKDAHEKEWKDVTRYRGDERGDMIFVLNLEQAIARHLSQGSKPADDAEKDSGATPSAQAIASTPWSVHELVASPDGRQLAFVTNSVSGREEKVEEFEIYSVDLASASPDRPPRQLTHNSAQEQNLHWDTDSQHIFFSVESGSVEGKYRDTQMRLYRMDAESGQIERWGKDFAGAILQYSVLPAGGAAATARVGTEVQVYTQVSSSAAFSRISGWPGTYDMIATSLHSPRAAFIYSALQKPTEVYIADSIDKLGQARPITSFNKLFSERDLPQGKTYHWAADDGAPLEGMLMYPPGKFEAKNLPVFVLIHGGPDDADGNHFAADWYAWDRLAATQGWLVFEPNYRGSTGYGDKFLSQIVPEIVSRPGKDILEGVDALVKDGIADPAHLAVGGYSYGGYMTNWLITQTTRFKAAVTGAGAAEHTANWGNDDTTFDDAYFLGGEPWEATQRYIDEAAIYQISKVRTPTHIVAGGDDIRVAVAEAYLLDHALHNLGVPSELLLLPGEGHELDKNPWHGKIKVREELQWLQKYGGIPTESQATH